MAQNVKLSTIKKPTVNKTTTIENTTPQRTASDGLSTPNAVINDENRILKSLRSSKIPTIKKLVTTTKSEKVNGLNLQPRIGPSKKSIIPVAKPNFKSVISAFKQSPAVPRAALKSIENMDSTLHPIQSKKFYSTSTPTPANRKQLKVFSENEEKGKISCSLSNINITRIHVDGEELDVTVIHKGSAIKK